MNFKLTLGEKKHFGVHLITKLHFVLISINLHLQSRHNIVHLKLKITWCDLPVSFNVGSRLCTCFSSWCPQLPVCPSGPPQKPPKQRPCRSSPRNPWWMQMAASTTGKSTAQTSRPKRNIFKFSKLSRFSSKILPQNLSWGRYWTSDIWSTSGSESFSR
jgi:hypothetical protein